MKKYQFLSLVNHLFICCFSLAIGCSTVPVGEMPKPMAVKPVLSRKSILTIDTGGHMAAITKVMFTSDGKFLVSVSNDKTVRMWDASTGEQVTTWTGHDGESVWAVDWSDDGQFIVTGLIDQPIHPICGQNLMPFGGGVFVRDNSKYG